MPGVRFRISFFVFPRSVTNRRLVSRAHATLVHAYDTWNLHRPLIYRSCCREKPARDSMIFRAMKSHTSEHTVRGRPTLSPVYTVPDKSLHGQNLVRFPLRLHGTGGTGRIFELLSVDRQGSIFVRTYVNTRTVQRFAQIARL